MDNKTELICRRSWELWIGTKGHMLGYQYPPNADQLFSIHVHIIASQHIIHLYLKPLHASESEYIIKTYVWIHMRQRKMRTCGCGQLCLECNNKFIFSSFFFRVPLLLELIIHISALANDSYAFWYIYSCAPIFSLIKWYYIWGV